MKKDAYTDDTILARVDLADQALQLLNNPAFTKAWDDVERDYMEALLALPPEEDMQRWRMVCKINALREIRLSMTSIVASGKTAEKRRHTP